MTLDPTNWQTWHRLDDHPIFGPRKSQISEWSNDPSQYDDIGNYSTFKPEWYAHVDPNLSIEQQREIVANDMRNLAESCCGLIERYGSVLHELVVLDDFTIFARIMNDSFSIAIYPIQFDADCNLMLFIDSPVVVEEIRCSNPTHLTETVTREIAG